MVVAPRGTGTTAAGDPVLPVVLPRHAMTAFDWEITEREVYDVVTAEWGDVDGGAVQEVRAGSGDKSRRLRNTFATRQEAQRAVDAELAMAGRAREAQMLFDRLLSYASPTGLFSEEIGPNGRLLGNMPQAFTHLALISAAVRLDEVLDG